MRAPVSHCEAVCANPGAELVSMPHREDETRCRPVCGQQRQGREGGPFKSVPRNQSIIFLPGLRGRAEVRFYSRIKRWLHRISHQPAVRTETAKNSLFQKFQYVFAKVRWLRFWAFEPKMAPCCREMPVVGPFQAAQKWLL